VIFVQDPISLALLLAAAVIVVLSLRREVKLVTQERPVSP
jgi:hypothetical protein